MLSSQESTVGSGFRQSKSYGVEFGALGRNLNTNYQGANVFKFYKETCFDIGAWTIISCCLFIS